MSKTRIKLIWGELPVIEKTVNAEIAKIEKAGNILVKIQTHYQATGYPAMQQGAGGGIIGGKTIPAMNIASGMIAIIYKEI